MPHGDNHDLWIDPDDPDRMIESNDGGANVSFNGGRTWSSIMNQPTAQFYRVATDDRFPYWVYGAQQDNTHGRDRRRAGAGAASTSNDWYPVGGGESGWIAPKPKNPRSSSRARTAATITRYDHRTGQTRNVVAWPQLAIGRGGEGPEVPLPVERADRRSRRTTRTRSTTPRRCSCAAATRGSRGRRSAPT